MFVVLLTYCRSLDVIDGLLEAHRRYLDVCYDRGVFLASGRREPRTGGVILARAESREALAAILAEDPFHGAGAASYEIIEFTPGKVAPGLEGLLA
jgi:uncharacterized protein YciI